MLDDLAAATAAVAAVSFVELPEQSVKDALVAIDACRNRLDAAAAHVAGVSDAQAMWAGDGARSSAWWIAAHGEAARGAAVRDVKLGEVLAGELDRRSRALYESDRSEADANGTPLARTAAQRRADALVDIALHASLNEDGATINRTAVTAVILHQITYPSPLPPEHVGPVRPQPGAGRGGGAVVGCWHRGPSAQRDDGHRMPSDHRRPAPPRDATAHPAGPQPTTWSTGSTTDQPTPKT